MFARLSNRLKKDFTLMTILLIPISVAINLIGGRINSLLKLPLHLDTIGTVLSSILGGPFVGVATALVGKMVSTITSPGYFAFILVSIGLAITVGIFSRKGMFTSIGTTIIGMLVSSIIVAIIGSFVRITFYGGITGDGSSLIIATLIANGKEMVKSVFGIVFISNLIDKSLAILLSLIVTYNMPERFLIKYPCGDIYVKDKRARRTKAES